MDKAGKIHPQYWHHAIVIVCIIMIFILNSALADEKNSAIKPVLIGLDADMSSGSAESGTAIQRGIELALDEINASGGILGRPLALIVRDHHGNPTRGVDNIIELASMQDLVAVVGGLHTPVAMAELETIHKLKVIYLGPWAAGTPIVKNGYSPNFVFRISVRDEFAGAYLISQALDRGFTRLALLLENTAWGQSNEKAMKNALIQQGLSPVTVQWFNWGTKQIPEQLRIIDTKRADVIMLVANAPEGEIILKNIAALPAGKRRPVISHWGITGGHFFRDTRNALSKTDLTFLQTFSFLASKSRHRSAEVAKAYLDKYDDCNTIEEIKSPVGTAHAYDLVHILALSIKKAGNIDRNQIRDALEHIDSYSGLVRDYTPPFTPQRHDALTSDDFHMARFSEDGTIIQVEKE